MRSAPPAPLGIVVAVAAMSAGAIALGVGGDAARRASDILWPVGTADPRVVVVAIDPASQERHGPWPWSRAVQADLVSAIVAGGAAAVGYDVIVGDDAAVDPESDAATERLADALASVPSVVASGYASVVRNERGLLVGSEPLWPDARIAESAAVAHTLVPADADGTIRSLPLVVETPRGELVPAFAAALASGGSAATGPLIVRPGAVQLHGLTIPAEQGATMRIAWTSQLAQDAPSVVSAADLLDGTGTPALDGAIVLVGIADVTIGDAHVTPIQPGATTPGVIVQAQALSTILRQTWVAPSPWWVSALGVLLLGGLAALAALRLRPWLAALAALALAGVWVLLGAAALPLWGTLLDLVRVPIAVIACAVAVGILRLVREQRDRRRAVGLFSRYVPDAVAQRLLDERGERAIDTGSRVNAAVLFCDLRGFTPLAGSLEPDAVRRALDIYYDYACERVFAHRGTTMQFVGDEVFAVFGAPEPADDPAGQARSCAVSLLQDVGVLHAALAGDGLPPIAFGIGVHLGDVVAGTVGPHGRQQYAVVGDAVNVGSRLCSAAGPGELVISADAATTAWPALPRTAIAVRGKSEPVEVVRVTADS